MDQNTLINESAQFINQASAAQGRGDTAEASGHLVNLLELLTKELGGKAPGPEPTPDEPLST